MCALPWPPRGRAGQGGLKIKGKIQVIALPKKLKNILRHRLKGDPVDLVTLTNEVREVFKAEGRQAPSSVATTLVAMLDEYGFKAI